MNLQKPQTSMLSKSRYLRGKNCCKSLWLYVHKREEQRISENTQALFSRGISIGEHAREYFPYGKMAVLEDHPGSESISRTQDYIAAGAETIYEATFFYDNTLVAVDIINKNGGKWYMYEVKGTNSVKNTHIEDAAIQYYVVNGSGLELSDVFIMHLNRNFVKRGKLDIHKLFTYRSVFSQIKQYQKEITAQIQNFLKVMEGEEPAVEMGNQCRFPYSCDFYEYCSPPTVKQKPQIKLSNEPIVNTSAICDFISKIQYPVAYLDFETISPGIPLFDESRPFQQIPFQYSLHIQNKEDDVVNHFQYLANAELNTDPRPELIENLIKHLENCKTILVYYMPFELGRIKEMARDFPQYADKLQIVAEKMIDLIIPFKKGYFKTESMLAKSSLKAVFPAVCPEIGYDDLEISDGMTAGNAFLNLYFCNDENIIAQTRKNLLEYCKRDTLAMVKIFDILKK